MTATREHFEQGMTYEQYKAQMTRNRERLEEIERNVTLAEEDVAWFRDLPEPLDVIAIVEDWCGDVIANAPVLARLAEESGKLNVRYLPRDQHLDLMDQYLNEGKFRSIPTFIFFDSQWRELGVWIERPARMTALQRAHLDDLYATDPALAGIERGTSIGLLPDAARERVSRALAEFRAANRVTSEREVVREIRELLQAHFAPEGAGGAE